MKTKLLFFLLLFMTVASWAANTVTSVTQVTRNTNTGTAVDYTITGTTPFSNTNYYININDLDHSVVIFTNLRPSEVISNWLKCVRINGTVATNGTNCIVQMYNRGAIVFPYASTYKPLTCYSGANYSGTSYNNYGFGNTGGFMNTLTAANGLNNIKSFKLKRGHMVTFAVGTGGWGYSRCFIADKEDLEIANLPAVLNGKISSYRLFHWYNASKAGVHDTSAEANAALHTTSCFDWGQGNSDRLPDVEWVAHHIYEDWPSAAACGAVSQTCHMKTNNEPGNNSDDHPQDVATVLGNWQNLMRTGMRLCSESSHDGSMAHLTQFMQEIDRRGWRCDIVDLHGYWDGQWNSLDWYIDTYAFGRPVWFSEWLWGASWSNNGAFANGRQSDDATYNGTVPILQKLIANNRVERFFYWNSEQWYTKIWRDNALTKLGDYYSKMQTGLAYQGTSYVPTVVIKAPYNFSGSVNGNSVTFTWSDSNGDMMDEIRLQYKTTAATSWTTLATVTRKDKTDGGDQSYTYSGTLNNAKNYNFRVVDIYDGKEYPSGVMMGEVTEGYLNFMPSNVGDYYFMFYSKEASSNMVWSLSNDNKNVYYRTPATKIGTDLNQLWALEDNGANGGYSFRNLADPDYLMCTPNSWDFISGQAEYKVNAAKTAFLPEFTDDYCVVRNVAHGTYVGLWDNDKNFAVGERLAGNRTNYTGTDSGDKVRMYAIPRSTVNAVINSSSSATQWGAGGTYYLYNTVAGQFLCAGNSWGTQASLGTNGIAWTLESSGGLYRLKNNGNNLHLFPANDTEMYVDGGDDRMRELKLDQNMSTGLTYISVNPSDATYGTAAKGTTYIGWDGGNNTVVRPLLAKESEATAIKWQLMSSLDYAMYHSTVTAAYESRRAMLANVKAAVAKGVGAAQIAVFENPASSAGDLVAANTTLAGILNGTIQEEEPEEEPGILDVTSTYLKNAKFDEGDMIAVSVHTYNKDITGSNKAQLQAVNQWTIPANGDARSGAQYAVNSGLFLGGTGFDAPATNSEGTTTGGMLGVLGVWTGVAQYTQDVTLPAGTYTITYAVYNVGGADNVTKDLFGFLADDGSEYLCTEKSFPVGRWSTITKTFTLISETSGKISVGYAGANAGSGSQPHLFVDYVKIETEKVEEPEPVATEILAPEIPGVDPRTWTGGTDTPIYIYNVESDAFLNYGMNWNTNAIATRLAAGDQSESARHNSFITYNAGVLNMIDGDHKDRFVGTNSGTNDVWVDFTGNKDWAVIEDGTNTYNIAFGSATGAKLDVSYLYGGHLTTVDGVGHTKWAFIPTDNVTNGKYAVYKAKKRLYDLYSALDKAGLTSKYADAINTAAAIYNNDAATANNINGAAKNLAKALGTDMPSSVDVSYLFTNADILGTKGLTSWTTTDMAFNNGEYEKYHAPITLAQTQTGLPTGMYSVKFHSLIRLDNGDAAPKLTVTGAQALTAQLPVMNTIDWGCNTNGNNNWADNGGKIIPNGMLSAAQGMTHQDAVAAVNYAPVDAGSLTVNVNITSGNQWFNMQGFSIEFTTISDYLTKMVADGQQCLTANEGKLPAGIVAAMNTNISNAQKGATSAAAAYTLGSGITGIIDDVPAILESYTKISELMTEANAYTGYNATTLKAAVTTANTALNSVKNHTEIDAAYNTLKAAYDEVLRSSTVDGANMTSLIVNPTIVVEDAGVVPTGWTGTTSSWRWTQGTGDNVMECWNGTGSAVNFDMHQTITGLAEGVYQLTVDMMNSTNGEAGAQLSGNECGFYAQTATSDAFVGVTEDGDELTTHTLYIYVREGEDLTIGVKNIATPTARWFACDNFTMTYRSLSAESVAELIATIPTDQANGELKAAMNTAKTNLQKTSNGANFGALTSAIADVIESAANYGHVKQAMDSEDRLDACSDAVKTEYAQLTKAVTDGYNNQTLSGTMENEIHVFETSLAQALINAGEPLTPLIRNNSFENGLTSWNMPTMGSDSGMKENSNGTYTTDGCDGNRLFNTWAAGDKGGYPLRQDIGYLPAGTYKLSALVASSVGSVFLLANDMSSAGTECSDKTLFLKSNMTFTLDKETRVSIGVAGGNDDGLYDGGNGSWYKVDKFELFTATSSELEEEDAEDADIITHPYNARGSQDIFGRFSLRNASTTPTEQGLCYSTTNKLPTVSDSRSTDYISYCGKIYHISDLTPSTAYYVRPYAKLKNGTVLYGKTHKVYTIARGNVSATFREAEFPDEATGTRIKNAINTTVDYWNQYTTINGYVSQAGYTEGVATADCSYGGWIRFGGNSSYQQCGTSMHENMHGIGVGTGAEWSTLCSGKNWTGPRVNEFIKFWENNEASTLYGDSQHAWCSNSSGGLSYTINGANEDAYSDLQRTANSLLAQAMGEDGLRPTSGSKAFAQYYAVEQEDVDVFYIQNVKTGKYLVDNKGALGAQAYGSFDDVKAAGIAAWTITFDPATAWYHINNLKTGNSLSHENYAWGMNKADANIAVVKSVNSEYFWLNTPTNDRRNLLGSLACGTTALTDTADANGQDWRIIRVRTSFPDVNEDEKVSISDMSKLIELLLQKDTRYTNDHINLLKTELLKK